MLGTTAEERAKAEADALLVLEILDRQPHRARKTLLSLIWFRYVDTREP